MTDKNDSVPSIAMDQMCLNLMREKSAPTVNIKKPPLQDDIDFNKNLSENKSKISPKK